jgi:hypothetical protein
MSFQLLKHAPYFNCELWLEHNNSKVSIYSFAMQVCALTSKKINIRGYLLFAEVSNFYQTVNSFFKM